MDVKETVNQFLKNNPTVDKDELAELIAEIGSKSMKSSKADIDAILRVNKDNRPSRVANKYMYIDENARDFAEMDPMMLMMMMQMQQNQQKQGLPLGAKLALGAGAGALGLYALSGLKDRSAVRKSDNAVKIAENENRIRELNQGKNTENKTGAESSKDPVTNNYITYNYGDSNSNKSKKDDTNQIGNKNEAKPLDTKKPKYSYDSNTGEVKVDSKGRYDTPEEAKAAFEAYKANSDKKNLKKS